MEIINRLKQWYKIKLDGNPAPKYLSGAKIIFLSSGRLLMIFSALDEVQIISDAAFTPAEQLI